VWLPLARVEEEASLIGRLSLTGGVMARFNGRSNHLGGDLWLRGPMLNVPENRPPLRMLYPVCLYDVDENVVECGTMALTWSYTSWN
jgi:hypothetical protein